MTKAQLQQLFVALLLLFVIVWMLTRKAPESSPPQLGPIQPAAASGTAAQGEGSRTKRPETSSDLNVARDIFSAPPLLAQKLEQRQQEEMALEKQRALPAVTNPIKEPVSVQSPADTASFEVQGIFWGVAKPQAIINRKIVSVGDTIDDAKVEAITKEGVTLSLDGRTLELKAESSIRSSSDDHNKKQGQSQTWSTFNSR